MTYSVETAKKSNTVQYSTVNENLNKVKLRLKFVT